MIASLMRYLDENPDTADRVKAALNKVGYNAMHWTRVVPYQICAQRIEEMGPSQLDVLEIAAGRYWPNRFSFKSFTEMNYPEFDICKDRLDRTFDLIIADNVFEHLLYPNRAAQNVRSMLNPGGYFFVLTPFLIRHHEIPVDCTRWTETGIRYFLMEAGFDGDGIETGSWGNRSCVKANFTRWARRGFFGSLKNESEFPVQVWAFAPILRV